MNFAIKKKSKSELPDISWVKIKNAVLGKDFDLSLVFLGEKEMERIHIRYLKKQGATTVMSFLISKDLGEIFLCPFFIKKNAKKYNLDYNYYTRKIFAHGLLHLKGLKHGKKMDKEENKIILKTNK